MKFRQISIVLGLLILGGAVFLTMSLMAPEQQKEKETEKEKARAVRVKIVENDSIPATIPVTGRLEASERIEIYAEVQGKFTRSSKHFKEGVAYEKGEVLIRIDSREARLSLQSQKSDLMNRITQMLPDLKIDYPDHYKKWQQYLQNLDVTEPLKPLPKAEKGKIKYFIASRNIYNLYYTIQSQQERLSKYTIRAPFDGVVTQSMIDPGTLVRPGQKLGEFINPKGYELSAALGSRELNLVDQKDSVTLLSNDINGHWAGKVIRIGNKIDPGTQTAQVFIGVSGKRLKEGMYLEGEIYTGQIGNAFKIARKLVEDDRFVWIVKDGKLAKTPVEVAHDTRDIAIVKGLENGTKLLNESMPSAYEGMPVKPVEETNL